MKDRSSGDEPGGGGGGGQLGFKHARMCVSKSEGNGSFFDNRGLK